MLTNKGPTSPPSSENPLICKRLFIAVVRSELSTANNYVIEILKTVSLRHEMWTGFTILSDMAVIYHIVIS